ncbi:MAG: hypothetical protein AB4426_07205 [Xenococcaceae cyanobacterium]
MHKIHNINFVFAWNREQGTSDQGTGNGEGGAGEAGEAGGAGGAGEEKDNKLIKGVLDPDSVSTDNFS